MRLNYDVLDEFSRAQVKLLARILGVITQQLTGVEFRTKVGAEALHPRHELIRAQRINVTKRSAQEWREAQAEDGANISFDGVRQDALN